MIDVKLIRKPKSNGASGDSGIATNGNGYNTGGVAKEALHAMRADLAILAESANEAKHALESDHAQEAYHAKSAFDLDAGSPVRDQFLSSVNDDTAYGRITFEELIKCLSGLTTGDYKSGASGGKFDNDGNLEAHTAVIRTLAQIATAYVQQIGSERFINGFAGEGWQIWNDIATGNWNLEIDSLTVRKLMTVYEVLIQKIRAIGGQIIVSAGNGKIKEVQTDEEAGNYTITFEDENTFAVGDLVRCQTWTGANVKHYWVRVSAATADGIVVPVTEFKGVKPEQGDECVLMGSTDNPLRQNVVSISATEDGQPRIDVLNGIDSKRLDGCLRARLGNLDGITDSWFPSDNQPHGDGLYADNAYLRGSFLLTTGEDVKTKFEVIEGKLTSQISSVEKEFNEESNVLKNAFFNQNMLFWTTDNDATLFLIDGKWVWVNDKPLADRGHDTGNVRFFRLGNKWIWINDAPLAEKKSYVGIAIDGFRKVLNIKSHYLTQRNSDFNNIPDFIAPEDGGLKKAKKFYLSFYYRALTPGEIQVRFKNGNSEGFEEFEQLEVTEQLEASGDNYKTFKAEGFWNGTGDFQLSYTGNIYIYAVRLSLDRIDDIEQRYRTLFEQTDKRITMLAQAQETTTNRLTDAEAKIAVMADEILAEVSRRDTDLANGLTDAYKAYVKLLADQISLKVDNLSDDLLATGIDITNREISFTADRLRFTDNSGQEQMMFENGKLNAKAIDVDDLTASRLSMKQKGATEPTITITPEDKGMRIYDDEGVCCQEFTGEVVSDAVNRFFKDSSNGDINVLTSGFESSKAITQEYAVSEVWESETQTTVKFSSGTMATSVMATGFEWAGGIDEPRPSGHEASVTLNLYLDGFTSADCKVMSSRQLIAATSGFASNTFSAVTDSIGEDRIKFTFQTVTHGSEISLAGKSVRSLTGGFFRLTMGVVADKTSANDVTNYGWGDSAPSDGNPKAIVARWLSDLYVSNFFANGFCLGTRKDDYVTVFKTDGGMIFEAVNGKSGIRLTENGLEKMENGIWKTL